MKRRRDIERVKEIFNNPDEVTQLRRQGWILLSVRTAGIAAAGIPHQNLIYQMGQPRKLDTPGRKYSKAS